MSHAKPNPANPFSILVRDLVHRPGESRDAELTIIVPEKMGEGMVAVPEGATLNADMRYESLHDGILVSAEVDTVAVGECSRCLKSITVPVEVDIQELFAYSSDEAFEYEVHDDHVDLEPLIRDAVVLSLPFQPVCEEDCPGLHPTTGEELAKNLDYDFETSTDPRWSALNGFEASTDNRDRGISAGADEN
ncbi:DUF177 domain-containing protein [Homoserinimonas sp. OAct 916]|uniref:YceD family protein n=1 Tax=Homoserinimonas sp. OAct 916 TaxID=2211450 RepID=UPI000DBE05D9|nr:DUF177 domain-containing protein [Homoserinimonas sp. OAct 916]